jgi:hypothetical protein
MSNSLGSVTGLAWANRRLKRRTELVLTVPKASIPRSQIEASQSISEGVVGDSEAASSTDSFFAADNAWWVPVSGRLASSWGMCPSPESRASEAATMLPSRVADMDGDCGRGIEIGVGANE